METSLPPEPGPLSDLPPKNARTWAMLCHISALIGHIIPFGNIFGPLVVWLIKKDEHPFIDDQGKEAINFQITVTIAFLISGVLVFVFIGVVLLPIVYVVAMILLVIATIKANEGVRYRYPWVLRLIS